MKFDNLLGDTRFVRHQGYDWEIHKNCVADNSTFASTPVYNLGEGFSK
jgi:hypothetical protein